MAQNINEIQNLSPIGISTYNINASFYTKEYDLECNVDMILQNMDQIDIDEIVFFIHPEFEIKSIHFSLGTELKYNTKLLQTDLTTCRLIRKINIKLPESNVLRKDDKINFVYKGWYSKSHMSYPSSAWIGIDKEAAFLRSVFNSVWFPVLHYDEQSDNDYSNFMISINVPDSMRVLAFGRNISNSSEDGRYISVWRTDYKIPVTFPILWIEPASNWSNIGNESLQILYNNNSDSELAAKRYIEVCSKLLDCFNDRYGVGLVSAPFYIAEVNVPMGGYPSINIVGLSKNSFNSILHDYFSVSEWIGHEMVHQYVRTGYDIHMKGLPCIQDGFALYFHIPVLIDIFGRDFEKYIIEKCWESYIRGREKGFDRWGNKLPLEKPIADITIEEYPEYKDRFLMSDKLILILYHLQKDILGDEIFYSAYKNYLKDFRDKPASLNDFKRYMENESGRNLDKFFDMWFYSTEPLPEEWRKNKLKIN